MHYILSVEHTSPDKTETDPSVGELFILSFWTAQLLRQQSPQFRVFKSTLGTMISTMNKKVRKVRNDNHLDEYSLR